MIRVAHLRNEADMGGVDRCVSFLTERLGPPFEQRTVQVDPSRFTPMQIDADVLVWHISSIWTRQPYIMALRAMRPNRPLILVEHSYTESFIRRHVDAPDRFAIMLRTAYGLASRVVSVSQSQSRWLLANKLVRTNKLHTIRPATEMAALFNVPLPAAQPQGGILHLGAYGRYSEEKGFDTLIEAMRLLPPDRFRLSLRGAGVERDNLMAMARDLSNVNVGGLVHDLAGFLSTVDSVVAPSRRESFGQVIAEARAAGRPVVASNVDGLPEQIEPAFGITLPPDDPKALAEAIIQLPTRNLHDMGALARRSVMNHTTDTISSWRELLFDVVPGKHRAAAPAATVTSH